MFDLIRFKLVNFTLNVWWVFAPIVLNEQIFRSKLRNGRKFKFKSSHNFRRYQLQRKRFILLVLVFRKWSMDKVFGQICSEIERDFFPNFRQTQKETEPTPKYRPKRLPANAQLLQLAKAEPRVIFCDISMASKRNHSFTLSGVRLVEHKDSVEGGAIVSPAADELEGDGLSAADRHEDSGFHSSQLLPGVSTDDSSMAQVHFFFRLNCQPVVDKAAFLVPTTQ